MTIGEPKHPLPDLVAADHRRARRTSSRSTRRTTARPSCAPPSPPGSRRRYGVAVDPETQIIAAQRHPRGPVQRRPRALARDEGRRPAGDPDAEPVLPGLRRRARSRSAPSRCRCRRPRETGFLPDYAALPPALLDRVTLCYLCSPANPQGAVADAGYWRGLIALAERHDFRILADECYGEIYRDTPPPGALETAAAAGADPERVVVFHSLSKRSNAPGLRSGFAAGGPRAIAALRQLRAYGGAPLPLPLQRAATALWQRRGPRRRPAARSTARSSPSPTASSATCRATPRPQAGFFLWLRVGDGEAAALRLWRETGVRVLPGGYLGRATPTGAEPRRTDYIRVALVADAAAGRARPRARSARRSRKRSPEEKVG